MNYLDWWQDQYDNLLPEDFEDKEIEDKDEEYIEEYEDEQNY